MTRINSFPYVAHKDARILILGSMPGKASLNAQQYYAHPHNAFWSILSHILDIPPNTAYDRRLAAMTARGIALWDVLKSCHRKGSLDTAIKNECPNDFPAFFAAHPQITDILFNGKKAESAFRRHVLKSLDRNIALHTLPSTSPANAQMNAARKCEIWTKTLGPLLPH